MSVSARSQLSPVEDVPRTIPAFGLRRTYRAGNHTLILAGELDLASAPQLGQAVAHIPMDRSSKLVLDLHDVTFIDCAGVRAILAIQELCAQRGCGFSLVPGRAQVQRLFELCKLDGLPFRNDDKVVGSDLSGGDSPSGSGS